MLLNWVIVFLIIAVISGVFGFSGVANESAWIAKILFLVFLILFAISFVQQQGWLL
jgi:uncharacterized membrane protein YtjA (UPF0391 family)